MSENNTDYICKDLVENFTFEYLIVFEFLAGLFFFILLSIISFQIGIVFTVIITIPVIVLTIIYLDDYFNEVIIIEDEKVIYISSKYDAKKRREIERKGLEKILLEFESFTSGYGYRNNIYLIDQDSNKHILLEKKVRAINEATLNQIAEYLKIPIEREYWVLDSDLKKWYQTDEL